MQPLQINGYDDIFMQPLSPEAFTKPVFILETKMSYHKYYADIFPFSQLLFIDIRNIY